MAVNATKQSTAAIGISTAPATVVQATSGRGSEVASAAAPVGRGMQAISSTSYTPLAKSSAVPATAIAIRSG